MFTTRYWAKPYWTNDYWPESSPDVFPACIAKLADGTGAGSIYQSDVIIGQLAQQNRQDVGQLAQQNRMVAGMVFGPADNPDITDPEAESNSVTGQLATQNRVIVGMILCTYYDPLPQPEIP